MRGALRPRLQTNTVRTPVETKKVWVDYHFSDLQISAEEEPACNHSLEKKL